MDTINSILDYLNKLESLPSAALVFLGCLVFGYAWRFIHLKWLNNDAIPVFVILNGAFLNLGLQARDVGGMSLRLWLFRTGVIGAVIGFAAWLAHNLIISRIEDKLSSMFPAVANLLNGKTNAAVPVPPTPPAPTPPTP